MTRFIYLADTHFGAAPMGYTQQRGYPARLSELIASLEQWIAAHGPVDFIVHGGDMADAGEASLLRAAAAAFSLTVPVYLCVGNHDLAVPDTRARPRL